MMSLVILPLSSARRQACGRQRLKTLSRARFCTHSFGGFLFSTFGCRVALTTGSGRRFLVQRKQTRCTPRGGYSEMRRTMGTDNYSGRRGEYNLFFIIITVLYCDLSGGGMCDLIRVMTETGTATDAVSRCRIQPLADQYALRGDERKAEREVWSGILYINC